MRQIRWVFGFWYGLPSEENPGFAAAWSPSPHFHRRGGAPDPKVPTGAGPKRNGDNKDLSFHYTCLSVVPADADTGPRTAGAAGALAPQLLPSGGGTPATFMQIFSEYLHIVVSNFYRWCAWKCILHISYLTYATKRRRIAQIPTCALAFYITYLPSKFLLLRYLHRVEGVSPPPPPPPNFKIVPGPMDADAVSVYFLVSSNTTCVIPTNLL